MENQDKALVIERVFDAPPELVWKAWTDPDMMKKWHGPKVFTCPFAKMDVRVGGTYLLCMKATEGEEIWQKGIWSTGEYREVVPPDPSDPLKPARLVMTDSFADEKGNVVPSSHYGMEGIPLEMMVTVTFEALEEGRTKMTLVHEGLPAGEHTEGAYGGWNESLDKLEAALQE